MLTDRQTIILTMLSNGHHEKTIASYLGVSVNTVKAHTAVIRRKLGATNKTAAVAKAWRAGLIQ